jgi:hypothetical protein
MWGRVSSFGMRSATRSRSVKVSHYTTLHACIIRIRTLQSRSIIFF